jgi:hypothetical protein
MRTLLKRSTTFFIAIVFACLAALSLFSAAVEAHAVTCAGGQTIERQYSHIDAAQDTYLATVLPAPDGRQHWLSWNTDWFDVGLVPLNTRHVSLPITPGVAAGEYDLIEFKTAKGSDPKNIDNWRDFKVDKVTVVNASLFSPAAPCLST